MTLRLPLFDDDVDVQSVTPKTTKDDVEFAKQRRRNRKKPGRTPDAPEKGPCCFRCRNWLAPGDGDEFGDCRHLGVSTERNPAAGIERGTVVSMEEAKEYGIYAEPLRTGPAYRCRGFQQIEKEVAA